MKYYQVTEEWQANPFRKDREVFVISEEVLRWRFPEAIKSLQAVSKVILNRTRLSGIHSKIMIEKIEESR